MKAPSEALYILVVQLLEPGNVHVVLKAGLLDLALDEATTRPSDNSGVAFLTLNRLHIGASRPFLFCLESSLH